MFDQNLDGANRIDWLVDLIGNEIVSGELNAGDKISEPRLAKRFGLSRAPVREAIRRLEERRLVVRKQNTGVRVAEFSAADFVNLLHVREGLEGISARLAAERRNDEQIAQLTALCEQYEAAVGDSTATLKADLDFHFLIAQSSGNAMLASMLCDDFYAFFRIWRRRYPRLPGREEAVLRQHRAILDAIAARDAQLAELLMRHHVQTSRTAFLVVVAGQENTLPGGPSDKTKPGN